MFSVLALLLSLHLLHVQATLTVVEKSYYQHPNLSVKKTFFIEDGRCTLFIPDVLPGRRVAAIEVRVLESQRLSFSKVLLKTPLRSVLVHRQRDHLNRCSGRAEVQLSVMPYKGEDTDSLTVSLPPN